VSRVGQDPLSDKFIEFASQHRLDVSGVHRDPDKNIGIYSVSTDTDGERSFHYWRAQSAARDLFGSDDKTPTLAPARIVFLSGITMAILSPAARQRILDELQRHRQSHQSLIAFDSNYRPGLWESPTAAREVMTQMWAIADIALPSIDDEIALFGEEDESAVIHRFAQRAWHACAIKRAERGPVSLTPGMNKTFPAAGTVVDTTAAGDSFNGGYLAALLRDQTEAQCLQAGHACAMRVVGIRGAIG
jgi:2-dehydro-3-deoxygluconokinase